MSAVTTADASLLVFRVGLGVTAITMSSAAGRSKEQPGGSRAWMRPGVLHAWTASVIELGVGVLLLAGLATPIACAGVIGATGVAWIANHLRNGFLSSAREGYEYSHDVHRACRRAIGDRPGQ